ncbi:MAG: DUF2121 domain-containing protein [Methanothrix sp.]|nr:DUF2121 domain-containing protein [Methanothrix sp.]
MVAVAGVREAIAAGDRRSITFFGPCQALEEELYRGSIRSDQELLARARQLGSSLQVSDGREKVWRAGDVLVGEVREATPAIARARRVYLCPGAHMIVEIAGNVVRITSFGGTGCVIFGNRFTQKLASEAIRRCGGRVDETLIRGIMADAASRTASVSRDHTVLKSDVVPPAGALLEALRSDCSRSGWRLCALQ